MSTIEKNVPGTRELADLVREQEEELAHLRARLAEWERTYDATPQRDALFSTSSGAEVRPLYTELDREGSDPENDLSLPGEFPFTRGPYPTMYRTRLWTMRQFAGFATAEETNERAWSAS